MKIKEKSHHENINQLQFMKWIKTWESLDSTGYRKISMAEAESFSEKNAKTKFTIEELEHLIDCVKQQNLHILNNFDGVALRNFDFSLEFCKYNKEEDFIEGVIKMNLRDLKKGKMKDEILDEEHEICNIFYKILSSTHIEGADYLVDITKFEDDWFLAVISDNRISKLQITHVICDEFTGLLSLLESM